MFTVTKMPTNTRAIPKDLKDSNPAHMSKRINNEKDVAFFKTSSLGYKNISTYIDLLCECIYGTGTKFINKKYSIQNEVFVRCSEFFGKLEKCCDETNLTQPPGTALRFGHVAFRDWFDKMKILSRNFINDELASNHQGDSHFKSELCYYLTESFGNQMRIDYGTGHELNFMIFTMGLSNLVTKESEDDKKLTQDKLLIVTPEKLKAFVSNHGRDIHALFAHFYLKLCRRLQTKFRLEPAGSRGVYNMDDFQFLPFLFGTSQLAGIKYISPSNFYEFEQVDMYKGDFIFFEAVDFILTNKKGPFNEHSYTLWNLSGAPGWDNIFRRTKIKFRDEVLSPFPIIQHLLFGDYILVWNDSRCVEGGDNVDNNHDTKMQ